MAVKLTQNGSWVFVSCDDEKTQIEVDQALRAATHYTNKGNVFLNRRYKGNNHVTDFYAYNPAWKAFPFGLLERCQKPLSKKFELEVNVQRVFPSIPPDKLIGYELWPHQNKAVDALLIYPTGHVCIPTGGGKTLVIAEIVRRTNVKTIIVVPSKEILDQIYDRIVECLPNRKVSRLGGSDDIIRMGDVLITTFQTASSRIDDQDEFMLDFLKDAACLIVDECHHVPADSIQKIATRMVATVLSYGVSATPYRTDGLDILIEGFVGPIRYVITPKELRDGGYIVGAVVQVMNVPSVGKMSSGGSKNYSIIYRDKLVQWKPRNELIAEAINSALYLNKRTICFMKQVKHAEVIYKMTGADKRVAMVTGQMDKRHRKAIFADLKSGEILVLISTIGKEGLDIPEIEGVILAGGGSDPSQEVGRALRAFPGKTQATIWDTQDNQHYMLVSQSMARQRWFESQEIYEVVKM